MSQPVSEVPISAESVPAPAAQVESPPPAAQPLHVESDPRRRIHELARELMRTRNRQLLIEFLQLRRTLR